MVNASLVGLLLALLGMPAREPALKRFTYVEPHMGTRFKVILYAPDEAVANRASRAAFARIADLDRTMTDYDPNSELMRLCKKAGGPPVPVSDDLFVVLKRAQEVSRLSDGAFDVTVGPVVHLWRLARRTRRLPDKDDLAEALQLVDYDKVQLDEKHRTVQLLKPGMRLDLGGIAKGYSADAALEVLRQHGVTRGLVAAGGDIAVSGPPPDAEGWTIGIAPLEDPDSKPTRYLLLHDAAVSTSGDAEQYVEIDGKRYSHIVDPRTGLGLVGRLSVTVIARRGIDSDSMTKVVCVLGPEKGMKIIDQNPDLAAFMVRKTDSGEESFRSNRFPNLPQRPELGRSRMRQRWHLPS
jgi:thiamine biosynthesis lipoprotein